MSTLENKWAFVVRPAELFLLGPDPMITILSGLELEVEISAFGLGGKEGGVLLSGNIEVLIDFSTLSKFQLQHSLFRSIADLAMLLGSTGARRMISWMRMRLGRIEVGASAFNP
jgi:hypothetical protein